MRNEFPKDQNDDENRKQCCFSTPAACVWGNFWDANLDKF